MTFLNTALLFAIAGISIPIALHLLARKQPRQVAFPSIALLTQQFQTNRSRMRIRRWWLLAMRLFLLAALALALAQPVISGSTVNQWSTIGILLIVGVITLGLASVAFLQGRSQALRWSLLAVSLLLLAGSIGWGFLTAFGNSEVLIDSSKPVAIAIVVDNGPLLDWQSELESQAELFRRAARELLLSIHPDSRIAVLDRSSTPAAFALDRSAALSKIDGLGSLQVTSPLMTRIEAATRLLSTSEIKSRQVVVLSSLPQSSFPEPVGAAGLAEKLASENIRLTLWDQGILAGTDRSLSLATLSDSTPGPETPIGVSALLSLQQLGKGTSAQAANPTGNAAQDEVSVTAECLLYPASTSLPVVRDQKVVRPEPKPVDRISVQVQPGRKIDLRMTLPPLPIGVHHGAIRLVGEDALGVNDTAYFSVSVLPPSKLLIAGKRPEDRDEIGLAVSVPAALDDPAAQYRIDRVDFQTLGNLALSDYDGVFLLDPPQTTLESLPWRSYSQRGGGVLIATGRALGQDPFSSNDLGTFERRWRVPQPGTFLEITSPTHPALRGLSNLPGGLPLQDFRVQQYWQLTSTEQAQVLMRYAGTQHPALIEIRSSGQSDPQEAASSETEQTASPTWLGRTLVLTTPIPDFVSSGPQWNELFSGELPWPALLIVRQLTRYLTGRAVQPYSFTVGAPVTITLPSDTTDQSVAAQNQSADAESPGPESPGPVRRRLQWFPPLVNSPLPVEIPDAGENVSERSDQASPTKRLRQRLLIGRPKHAGVHWLRGAQAGLGFTVNVNRDQLNPLRTDLSTLDGLFGAESYQLITELDQMKWTTSDQDAAVSLWSPMMLAVLFAFLLEQLLANRFYRKAPNQEKRIRSSITHQSVGVAAAKKPLWKFWGGSS